MLSFLVVSVVFELTFRLMEIGIMMIHPQKYWYNESIDLIERFCFTWMMLYVNPNEDSNLGHLQNRSRGYENKTVVILLHLMGITTINWEGGLWRTKQLVSILKGVSFSVMVQLTTLIYSESQRYLPPFVLLTVLRNRILFPSTKVVHAGHQRAEFQVHHGSRLSKMVLWSGKRYRFSPMARRPSVT